MTETYSTAIPACFVPNIRTPHEFTVSTIAAILSDIQRRKFQKLIDALPASDTPEYKAAKSKLPAWAFNGSFSSGTTNDHFKESNGLFHIDIDDVEDIETIKQHLIDSIPEIYALWKSPSGKGLKGLIKIPDDLIHNDADFKKAFAQISKYFSENGVTIDKACKDVRRLCFVCSDSAIHINENAPAYLFDMAIWRQSDKPKPAPQNTVAVLQQHHDDESKYINRTCDILNKARNGEYHQARISAGKLAGGFIASGLVSESAIKSALFAVSDAISASHNDDPATIKNAHKAINDGVQYGLLNPVGPDRAKGIIMIDNASAPLATSATFATFACEPEPLRAPLPKPESYPVEALGDVLGEAAMALHESVKAPLALCCQSVLASASLAAQAHFDIKLPWGETKPLSLFLLTVAESGERKSGIDDVVLGAAKVQERQDMEDYQFSLDKYEQDLARWKAESEQNNKKAASAKSQEARDEAAYQSASKPKAPVMPLRFVTDPTVEGLFKLLAVGQPSVGLFSDEGGLLIGGHALNSDNALKTMARWCKLWDGSPFDRVRAGDGSGILYGRRMAMHQLAQPDVMTQLLGDRMANGQGFLARCLVAWPESTIGNRHIDQFEWAGNCKELKRLFAVFKGLMQAEPRTAKTEQELDPVELELDDAAVKMAIMALNQFETLMQSGNDLYGIRDRAAKALENACRIAGVLAVIDGGLATRSIGVKNLEQGLILIQWYLSEALRIRGAAVIPQAVCDAESLSKWLNTRDIKAFRSKQVLNKGPSQLRNKTRLNAAIKELVDNGYLDFNEPGTVIEGVRTRKSWSVIHVV